nr:mucin-1-like isoform X1 [Anser cygnoides]XP_047909345.1 mucin-1-like isoform X1 [Anser cygnoides]
MEGPRFHGGSPPACPRSDAALVMPPRGAPRPPVRTNGTQAEPRSCLARRDGGGMWGGGSARSDARLSFHSGTAEPSRAPPAPCVGSDPAKEEGDAGGDEPPSGTGTRAQAAPRTAPQFGFPPPHGTGGPQQGWIRARGLHPRRWGSAAPLPHAGPDPAASRPGFSPAATGVPRRWDAAGAQCHAGWPWGWGARGTHAHPRQGDAGARPPLRSVPGRHARGPGMALAPRRPSGTMAGAPPALPRHRHTAGRGDGHPSARPGPNTTSPCGLDPSLTPPPRCCPAPAGDLGGGSGTGLGSGTTNAAVGTALGGHLGILGLNPGNLGPENPPFVTAQHPPKSLQLRGALLRPKTLGPGGSLALGRAAGTPRQA